MPFIEIPHSVLKGAGFNEDSGGQWYNPNDGGDQHAHLIGRNYSPGYDPVKNPNPPPVLEVQQVEIKISISRRWWGKRKDNGTFTFDQTTIASWGSDKATALALLALVPNQLRG